MVRLALGVILQCALLAGLGDRGTVTYFLFGVIGIAIVLNLSAVPNLDARSSVLMVVGSCSAYAIAYVLAGVLLPPLTGKSSFGAIDFITPLSDAKEIALATAVAGLVGGMLFAVVAFLLLFRHAWLLTAFSIGALTVPSALAFSHQRYLFSLGYGNTFLVHNIAWLVLFTAGLGGAIALHGRAILSRA